jgi:uncharacterized radical SAM superfamily Fe-S cluster-containing enzyme
MSNVLYYTKSVCPACLQPIIAAIVDKHGAVYMEKNCPEHGDFSTVIWQDTAEHYIRWLDYGGLDVRGLPKSREEALNLPGVSQAGGESLLISPCSAALMVTSHCNSNCPVCFTRTQLDRKYKPGISELAQLLEFYKRAAGSDAPVEFCGGEPTTREDLPELAFLARKMGFTYIQLNSNGIKLGESLSYCKLLRNSGITTVYLGFDGVSEVPYVAKYGRNMLDIKKRAINNCGLAGLAVVLVPCVVPGTNDDQLGAILEFAKENIPIVKGVFFQPISYFGTYPDDLRERITIPEILRRIEKQTKGEVAAVDFLPANCEHPQCSFNGFFLLNNGRLQAITRLQMRELEGDAVQRVRERVKKMWSPNRRRYLTIGGMAFQDAWNLDVLRLQRCTIQIIGRDKRLRSLCYKYLTNKDGVKMHPGIC